MKLFEDYQRAKLDLLSYFGQDIPTWYDVDFCDENWGTIGNEISWGTVTTDYGIEPEYTIEFVHEYIGAEYTMYTCIDVCGEGNFHMIFENSKKKNPVVEATEGGVYNEV